MIAAILAALLALTPYREDDVGSLEKRAQLQAIASAIAEFARTPEERAFLIAWGHAESGYSLRVHVGQCKRWECDGGRARSVWQMHRHRLNPEQWARMQGVENTRAQAARAVALARWALRQCPDDRVRGAFRVLGARHCDQPLRGEADRLATFERTAALLTR